MASITENLAADESIALVPRFTAQGYGKEDVERRRRWVEHQTGASLSHLGSFSLDSDSMRGNIENPIGVAQVPIGVAGPLAICGEFATGVYYVPLATTEGALVRSYERGMLAITRAGGAVVRVARDGNRASPLFSFADVSRAHHFSATLKNHFAELKTVAESTTKHGKLLAIECRMMGRDVIVDFDYHTADAHGMNMISKATEAACQWIVAQFEVDQYYVLSGGSSEKRASASLFRGGKGKHVTAGVLLPRRLVQTHLHSTPRELHHMWQRTLIAQLQAGVSGYNGHYANGLTALFIACGQDVANVANCAVGYTNFDVTEEGSLYVTVTLPSLTVATIGGGTALGTSAQCLAMLDCAGTGKSPKFAEIVASTILAGELSFGAALASGEFVSAHEQYGRNHPT
ncbi:MAG TPA: hydroxymethylglutaryl-CoA reductase [Pirellulaceae bacterium]|nr:hydroxymethylglutaryl-CoA reductase [Pirellulaceae bacterium]